MPEPSTEQDLDGGGPEVSFNSEYVTELAFFFPPHVIRCRDD